ncbi:hypothetical protein AA101099_2092 [Neoasaia chiangmaiensis NBRC 101099]|uniref:Uncharacterized protein n=2 Tax=Neoasaia chiangmaiensis TaxID=320497 RepID=A0A1U9KSW8_9PROT|nr:hypothetical protein [Neoasaia chiangmaiensis]AQS88923.1 hypothetical protein A0U93_14470 [Neoasaia chiangmaiensis]GBR40395.1 hypothetical protein AA101099_2092 [Neoasaia chiangmaiensis NBRC 101099]GEN13920.1 hypothetical protein NCH01_03510 [Neoasaia chiangmaiensis]
MIDQMNNSPEPHVLDRLACPRDASGRPAGKAVISAASALGEAALKCTAAYVVDDRQAFIQDSATFLMTLLQIWQLGDVDQSDVFREIDHRRQLGDLLLKLSEDSSGNEQGPARRWRPASTKLP